MLPDLRIVIAAVLSTFVLSAGVGFYASSRLIGETKKSTDPIASFEETPVNRIALSWPEPTRQPEALALDFAVTAKALRNPVRDVTSEPAPVAASHQPVRATVTASRETPAEAAPSQNGAAPAPAEATPAAAVIDAPKPAPEPDIRVAVQYPPVLELPRELQPPAAPAAPAVADAPPAADIPVITGSIVEEPKAEESREPKADGPKAAEPALPESSPAMSKPEFTTASRPEPVDAGADDEPAIADIPLPKPAPKIATKKATPKKAAAKKVVRRPVRRTPPVTDTVPNFFSFFNLQPPR